MAKHTDAVATTGAKASVETVVQDRVQGDVADTISDLREQVGLLKRQIAAEQNSHKQEVARLNEIVQQLQGRRSAPVVEAEPHTPQGAVSYVISFFEGVATGGAASDLRKAVHHAALRLSLIHI